MKNDQPVVAVRNVKAVDPGVGFSLEITDQNGSPFDTSLKVLVTLEEQPQHGVSTILRTTEITILDSIKEPVINFVVPFGDSAYTPGNIMKYTVSVYCPINSAQPVVITGAVFAASGQFKFKSNLPTVVIDNQNLTALSTLGNNMLASDDGKFIGVLRPNLSFEIYKSYQEGVTDLPPNVVVGSLNAPDGEAAYLEVKGGYVQIGFYIGGVLQPPVYTSNQQVHNSEFYIGMDGQPYLVAPGSTPIGVTFGI